MYQNQFDIRRDWMNVVASEQLNKGVKG